MQDGYLESYLSQGVERIIRGIAKMSVTSPGKGVFFVRFAAGEKKARITRQEYEKNGTHIPPFLISSITAQCNLRCKGCYAHANNTCADMTDKKELTGGQWGEIFTQAEELGICFILLAGGEPLTRKDILAEAGRHRKIIFPVFTNGTLIDDETLQLFSSNHNLLPILSLEGSKERTDARRGSGVYSHIERSMGLLAGRHILFGTSVTVTAENKDEVLSDEFIRTLKVNGCKALVYVEYVPADKTSSHLVLREEDRGLMDKRIRKLREQEEKMLFISFPGDEKESGGCLAAGRGFFHINAQGGAEPCPFSPYSDTNVLHMSLKNTLQSPLFVKIRTGTLLSGEHSGGCVLFEREEQVKRYWKGII